MFLAGFLAQAQNPPAPQNQKNPPPYAGEDFRVYKKSSFASPTWNSFVAEGFEALDREDLTTAIEFLRKATNLGCQSPVVYFKLALAYEATGSYYAAVQYYELARDQFAKGKTEHRYRKQLDENYGRALYLLGKKNEAMPFLIEAVKNGENPWALRIVAAYYLEKGNLASATICYERYLSAANVALKDKVEIYLLLARSYRNRDDPETAQKYYRQISVLDPENKEALDFIRRQETKSVTNNSVEKALEIFEKH